MNKISKITLSVLASLTLLTTSSLSAGETKSSETKSSGKSTGTKGEIGHSTGNEVFEYDAANGWWWYKQKEVDSTGKEVETKIKMTPKEKLDHDRNNKVIALLVKQNQKLEKVQERLEYAYPNITPIYTTNSKTGEECVTNSSEDCFVFPLQAEAQHVPVLANWLSAPSPTNSKNWLRWQAKYFNHLQKISVGARFAFLSDGPNAYPTNTTFVYNDNVAFPMSERVAENREKKIIQSMKDKLGLMIFMGGNTLLENSLEAYGKVGKYMNDPWNELNIAVVLPSEEAKRDILAKAASLHYKEVDSFWEKATIIINPELFKKFNIMVTPSVVATYKTDKEMENGKKKMIWQTISTGTSGAEFTRKGIIQFLVYNDIINPVEMATAINAADFQKNMVAPKAKISENNIFEDTKSMESK